MGALVLEHPARVTLPDYTVRVSARAKRVRLTVTPQDGLVIVVPRRFAGDVDAIVRDRRDWIERALGKVAERRALHLAGPDALLPDVVELAAIGERWTVEYREGVSASVRVRESGSMLLVEGAIDDAEKCLAALSRWLDRVARDRLPALLAHEAARAGATYVSVRIARQRTRWGSYSARGTVSLNRNLLFLPPHLAISVLRHELAHTWALDHSPRFWVLLERIDPGAHGHRRELRHAGHLVPAWAEA